MRMLNFDHWIAALRRAMKQVGIVSEYLLFIFKQSHCAQNLSGHQNVLSAFYQRLEILIFAL
jgi:hypothetical protein